MPARRALISVSDKTGVVEFARGLVELGFEIVSSGGTARVLAEAGVPVTPVGEVTGAGELLDGRVKTLHPAVHAGILANRRRPEHLEELARRGIVPVDVVAVNLYPFERVAASGAPDDEVIENIDIGGPAMVRAAAKNHDSVTVVTSPDRYDTVLRELRDKGEVSPDTRRELAADAFALTAAYDAAIAAHLATGDGPPGTLVVTGVGADELRYGENPHQRAAFYRSPGEPRGLAAARQLHGKQLSYNNLLDAEAAYRLVAELEPPACAIVKHNNPCGAAAAASAAEAYRLAYGCDTTSAFGGIVALNVPCDADAAGEIAGIFYEVVIAPGFDDRALEVLRTRKNLRLLEVPPYEPPPLELRSVSGGVLVQEPDPPDDLADLRVVTRAHPTEQQLADLRFAWCVAKHVKSNAIVFARDRVAVGVGAGQMSRVEAAELAARRAGERARGAVCASDAFFPFRDGLDAVVAAGATAVIQPGGSVRDEEVIAAADEHGIPMVFTGRRHFRH